MENLSEPKSAVEQAAEDLFNFAIDREDIKKLMATLSESAAIKRDSVEYELQILKIITVGWAIPYCLENSGQKDQITACYWHTIQHFSQNLSETFGLIIGQEIDYFQVLKDRLETYLNAMHLKPDAPEPAVVIGPEFAAACGNRNDVFTVMTGSRMFVSTVACVKQYLENLDGKNNARWQ